MKTGSAKSNILLYVFVLSLVLSPILPCQAASVLLGGKLVIYEYPPLYCMYDSLSLSVF